MQEAEYSEKDRIIENIVFEIGLKIRTVRENDFVVFWRYVKAVNCLITETVIVDAVIEISISDAIDDTINIKIVLN